MSIGRIICAYLYVHTVYAYNSYIIFNNSTFASFCFLFYVALMRDALTYLSRKPIRSRNGLHFFLSTTYIRERISHTRMYSDA